MSPLAGNPSQIDIQLLDTGSGMIDADWIRGRLIDVIGVFPHAVRRVNIVIADDRRMSELHQRHCGINGPTDVLTFPSTANPEPIEADIVVCVDEARRRAGDLGHTVERELLLYALHGLLHCAGFDDHDDAGYAAMHAEEDRILQAIGVGATFHTVQN